MKTIVLGIIHLRRLRSRPGTTNRVRATRPISAAAALLVSSLGARAHAEVHQLYIHTEGLEIVVSPNRGAACSVKNPCGVSNAAENTSWLPNVEDSTLYLDRMLPDADADTRDRARRELLAEIRRYFRGIGVMPTLERPASSVEYSMVVVGGSPADLGLPAGIAGLAPLDCDDSNRRDIAFVFANAIGDIASMARVAAQEAAHSYGLEHLALRQFVMHPEPIGGSHGFAAACVPLSPSPQLSNPDGIKCVHTCESLSHQNSFGELHERFGDNPNNPLGADNRPPKVEFSAPAQGAHFPDSPTSLRVDVDADDGLTGHGVVRAWLSINGGPAIEDPTYPFAFHVEDLRAGQYDMRVEVHDLAGHIGSDERTMYVGVSPHSDADERPIPKEGSITPHLEDRTGEPVTCTSDHACYEGTVCNDGICTHPESDGCRLTRQGQPLRLLSLFLVLVGLRYARD